MMKVKKIEDLVSDYISNISSAQNEEVKRQIFVILLDKLFGEMVDAKQIVKEFVFGAEHRISNINRVNKKSDFGRADTQYRSVIVEFEQNLKRTGEHAKDQLADYVAGNWNTGLDYNFTLIATDLLNWKIYSPDINQASRANPFLSEEVLLIERQSFTLSPKNKIEFYYFLDSILFRTQKKKPSLENIQNDFGDGSNALISFLKVMSAYFDDSKDEPELKVAFEQWQRFLSIAYGDFSASKEIFLIHTYLSVFAKVLSYQVMTNDDFIDKEEIRGILNGDIFMRHNIKNFTDNDFFAWVAQDQALKTLMPAFHAITRELGGYDFSDIDEDILKGVYQNLIDRDTRQSLGEYYTPDWLCESIVEHLVISKTSNFLDPACGSGSFLRVIAKKMSVDFPELTADQIASQVCGLDVHPLSVQITKATLLLAIKDKIQSAKRPVILSVYLANTLFTPLSAVSLNLFGDAFNVSVDDKSVSINARIFDSPGMFEDCVKHAEKLAKHSAGSVTMSFQRFESSLINTVTGIDTRLFGESLYELYKAFKSVKESGRDSIWEFIVRNLYKPTFFRGSFDFIVGNPPWFTYSSISNPEYQGLLKSLAKSTNTWPSDAASAPHMEIAAIFFAHCNEFFLKENGKLAFVLPRSIFSSNQHHNVRTGDVPSLKIEELWDLDKVEPLFNVPACVVFSTRTKNNVSSARRIPKSGRPGKVFSGKFAKQNLTLSAASASLNIQNEKFYLAELGNVTAILTDKSTIKNKPNYYKNLFKQGATITPRNFYFIQPLGNKKNPWESEVLPVSVHSEIIKKAKPRWKSFSKNAQIDSDFLFYTVLAQNILPFVLSKPPICLLPLQRLSNGTLATMSVEKMIDNGFVDTASWFREVEQFWIANRTKGSEKLSYLDRLNYNRGATSQNLAHEFVVIYNGSGKDAHSTVVRRSEYKIPFLFDCKAYLFSTNNELEAYFIAAFLNSEYPNRVMKPFQSRGTFGPRDIHKTILNVGLDKFDKNNPTHLEISNVSKKCHVIAKQHIETRQIPEFMNKNELGRQRLNLRELLSSQIELISRLFEKA